MPANRPLHTWPPDPLRLIAVFGSGAPLAARARWVTVGRMSIMPFTLCLALGLALLGCDGELVDLPAGEVAEEPEPEPEPPDVVDDPGPTLEDQLDSAVVKIKRRHNEVAVLVMDADTSRLATLSLLDRGKDTIRLHVWYPDVWTIVDVDRLTLRLWDFLADFDRFERVEAMRGRAETIEAQIGGDGNACALEVAELAQECAGVFTSTECLAGVARSRVGASRR